MKALSRHKRPKESVPIARPAQIVNDRGAAPPVQLGAIPPPHPGTPEVLWSGPPGTQQFAWTVDDGYCQSCIAEYVAFAQSSGIHLTLNPNGVFGSLWAPSVVAQVRDMAADRQVQFGNHTWDHQDLTKLSSTEAARDLTRNEQWIEDTFGITSRPYFRPPYGFYNSRVLSVAGELGYTSVLMWNGTFGDATLETPAQILGLAEQWLKPGTIMLGHLNHTPILSLFDQIQGIIAARNLDPVTLDEMFGTSRETG